MAATTTTSQPPLSAEARECRERDLATASLRPDDGTTPGPAVSVLRELGRIVVGVDETTLGFASRNSDTGEPEGFEVELAKEIAARLLGADVGAVVFKPVVTDTKLRLVQDGTIDMSISANSMSCRRWDDVSFSSEYYTARQAFLVPADRQLVDLAAVAAATICVTAGSSSIDILTAAVPAIQLLTVKTRPECLVAIQEGQVDAYFGHDSFLYGLQITDPNTKIQYGLLPNDAAVSAAHYGIAISNERPDLVRAVNAILEDIRGDGTWAAAARRPPGDAARHPRDRAAGGGVPRLTWPTIRAPSSTDCAPRPDGVGATLLAFDVDPTVLLLDAAALRGVTAQRWRAARLTVASVFERYRMLGDALERAAGVSADQLARFVTDPSIAIAGPALQLADRGLLDGSRRVTPSTPDALLAAMTADFADVRDLVADVAAVWGMAVPRVAGLRARADDIAARAAAQGFVGPTIDIDGLAADVADDPLGLDLDRLDAVDAELDSADARIAAVVALRVDTVATLDRATDELSSLAARLAEDAATDEAPGDVAALRDELDGVRELAADGAWADAAQRLTMWRAAVATVVGRLDAQVVAAARNEQERTELLGRLRAYAAKADRLELLEEAGVAECRRDALAALGRGDVAAASERIATYQRLVNAGAARVRGRS